MKNFLSLIYFEEEDYTAIFRDGELILHGGYTDESDATDMEDYLGGCYAFCSDSESFEVKGVQEPRILKDGWEFDEKAGVETLQRLQREQLERRNNLPLL